MYTEKVLDHFEHPRNVGALDDANGVGMVGNAKCGDIMQMFLKVNDDGIIEDVGFKTFGCGAAIATSSMATELIKGKSIEEALQLSNSAPAEDTLLRACRRSRSRGHSGLLSQEGHGGQGQGS